MDTAEAGRSDLRSLRSRRTSACLTKLPTSELMTLIAPPLITNETGDSASETVGADMLVGEASVLAELSRPSVPHDKIENDAQPQGCA